LLARTAAEKGHIVTFGCVPDHPATGYGYIKPGKPLKDADGANEVEKFVKNPTRKPPNDTSARLSLEFGQFLFQCGCFLAEYAGFEPESAKTVARRWTKQRTILAFISSTKNHSKKRRKNPWITR